MRPGLVGSGAGLLLLAGLLVLAALTAPGNRGLQSSRTMAVALPVGASVSTYLWSDNASYSAEAIAWRSSGTVTVTLGPAAGCHGAASTCSGTPSIVTWRGNLSGAWSTSAPPGTEWLLRFTNGGGTSAAIQVAATTSVGAPAPDPTWALAVQLVASTTLAAVGAIALFLGLFLRGGVYRRPEPPPDPGDPPGAH